MDSALRALSASDDLAVDFFTSSKRGDAAAQVCEYAILDLVANVRGLPVFRLVGEIANAMPVAPGPLRVPCYDTSLYIDEELDTTVAEASALIASEAMEGYERGHRAFKLTHFLKQKTNRLVRTCVLRVERECIAVRQKRPRPVAIFVVAGAVVGFHELVESTPGFMLIYVPLSIRNRAAFAMRVPKAV